MDRFPEPTHAKHSPSTGDAEPTYVGNSQSVGRGHEDHPQRMPHPFREAPPTTESGEGKKA